MLILSGAHDPIISAANGARLAEMLEQVGASVERRTMPAGHELTQADVDVTRRWLEIGDKAR